MVAQFVPPPPPPALPPVKLPVGYYRDVFINAVYGSHSALFFHCVYLLPPHTCLPFSCEMIFLSSLSPSSVPSIQSLCPHFLLSLCPDLIILLISSPAAVNVT